MYIYIFHATHVYSIETPRNYFWLLWLDQHTEDTGEASFPSAEAELKEALSKTL